MRLEELTMSTLPSQMFFCGDCALLHQNTAVGHGVLNNDISGDAAVSFCTLAGWSRKIVQWQQGIRKAQQLAEQGYLAGSPSRPRTFHPKSAIFSKTHIHNNLMFDGAWRVSISFYIAAARKIPALHGQSELGNDLADIDEFVDKAYTN